MNILVVGGGGREHALAWKLNQSERVDRIFVAPGNAGTAIGYTNVAIDPLDFERLIAFSKEEKIELVVVGPEEPLSHGIVDAFQEAGISIFGPNKADSLFESSKEFSKKFFIKHDIPTAQYESTTDYDEAVAVIKKMDFPVVIKADGLCAGKGVFIEQDLEAAEATLTDILVDGRFGDQGEKVVIEEFLDGVEQSLLCFVSNNRIIPMETAQDYKKMGEGDTGLNTGGIGAYSPSRYINDKISESISKIIAKIEKGLNEDGFNFHGILFIGFMIKKDEAKVLEFNVRFGDPETEVLMPRLKSDLLTVIEKTMDQTLEEKDLVWDERASVGVVLHSNGYPNTFENNIPITKIPQEVSEKQILFHNGTTFDKEGQLITNGGRVLTPVVLADSIEEARKEAYQFVEQIEGKSLRYRRDIAKKDSIKSTAL